MDKYEYKVRAEEIKALIAEGEFAEAVKIADTIDWRRVKSVMMLCTISDLYKINRRFQESKDILLLAYERHPGGRLIVYSLCELSIKMGEFVQAIEYYKEFVQIAPKDTGRYILQYKLYEAQDVSLEERIAVLEEFKKRDYREKWAYELAYLYHRVGLETRCVEECDDMVIWFGEGRYVLKALELKMLHQPLSPDQQEKYFLMKEEAERQMAELTAQEEEPEQNEEEVENQEMAIDNPEAYTAYEQQEEEPEEDEIRVKTVDVGQYNTINLQMALAESMKEILGEEEEEKEPEEISEEVSEESSIGAITQSIIAPLLQDTGEIALQESEEAVLETEPEVPVQMPEPETATEEVFFEEDVKDVLLEDTKEITIGEIIDNFGDTKELSPKRRIIYPTTTPTAAVPYVAEEEKPALNETQSEIRNETQNTITAHPNQLNRVKPTGFEQMLSQEYDGQISLVVPDKSDVEKQITGQMNITDIMAEWERMKRENEEKRREDVRKRVEQHTGNLFSEFDEATKTGLLEQLEKAATNAIIKESGGTPAESEEVAAQHLEDIVKDAEESKAQDDVISSEDEVEELVDIEEDNVSASDEISEAVKLPETTEEVAAESQSEDELALKVPMDTGILDLERLMRAEEDKTTAESSQKAEEKNAGQSASADHSKLRAFSEEERELFGRFAPNRKAKEQILQAIDVMSMDSYSGNVIITGEEEAGTLELAKSLVRMLQMSDSNFSGKVAKISGSTLNKKDLSEILSKLVDGALIIEHATSMSSNTATELNKALAKENSGLFVVMEGKKDEMNIFLRKNFSLMDNFNAQIDVESLDDQALVEYARQYAEEMEYSIDELGILALHTRIADMQTSDHEVTVSEVKDLVDDAIYFADKKNPKHFFDLLFGKRYDEEDMIILREKDFMHY